MLKFIGFTARRISEVRSYASANLPNLNIPRETLIKSTVQSRYFTALSSIMEKSICSTDANALAKRELITGIPVGTGLLSNGPYLPSNVTPARSLTKFSLTKGKRKTVKAVIQRFMRLRWGIWIRTKVGRHRTLWRKTESNRRRLRQHVFCNAKQSTLLDKMVTSYWKRPHYYVDDPYQAYHEREDFSITRRKPRPFP